MEDVKGLAVVVEPAGTVPPPPAGAPPGPPPKPPEPPLARPPGSDSSPPDQGESSASGSCAAVDPSPLGGTVLGFCVASGEAGAAGCSTTGSWTSI